MSADSPELEALFDSLVQAPLPEPVSAGAGQARSDDEPPGLESLFDSISSAVSRQEGDVEGPCPERVFVQLGQMTRGLNNLLKELGYDKTLEKVASELPDNRDRLNYIAAMTAKAAERTLNAAEAAQPIQSRLGDRARALSSQWDRLFNKQLGVTEFKDLVRDTRAYLGEVPVQAEASNAHLMEIIMAQDFQDLTGQVIKRVLDAAQRLETQLLALLIETSPEDKRQAVDLPTSPRGSSVRTPRAGCRRRAR